MKHICVLSAGPIFPDHVHGGSQQILRHILLELAKHAEVDVLCVRRSDLDSHRIGQRIKVRPVLKYRETYPNPYDVPALDVLEIAQKVHEFSRYAGVIYNHDAQMLFRSAIEDVPSIISCRDLFYPESIVGLLVNHQDTVIVNSTYAEACIIEIMRRQQRRGELRLLRIDNGVDMNRFSPLKGVDRSNLFGVRIDQADILVMSPGRAEKEKGHLDAIEMISHMQQMTKRRCWLAVPRYIDDRIDSSLLKYYSELKCKAKECGIEKTLVFFDWVRHEAMPLYYSAADLVVGLGTYVECFGNTYIEAICCGTPVIVSSVGANRVIPPVKSVLRVPYGQNRMAASAALDVIKDPVWQEVEHYRAVVRDRYDLDRMKKGYVDAILKTAECAEVGEYIDTGPKMPQTVKICPWIELNECGLYHDYEGGYVRDRSIVDFVEQLNNASTERERASIVKENSIGHWMAYERGVVDTPPDAGSPTF